MYAKVPGGEPIFQLIVVAMSAGATPKLHIVCPCEESILVPLTYIIDWDAPKSNVHIALLAPDDVIVVLKPIVPPVINACSLVLYVISCCSVIVKNPPAAVEIKFPQSHPAVPVNVAEPLQSKFPFIFNVELSVSVIPEFIVKLFQALLPVIPLVLNVELFVIVIVLPVLFTMPDVYVKVVGVA